MKKKNQLVAKIGLGSNDRFGNLNFQSLKELSNNTIVQGLPQIDDVREVCEECQLEK